MQDFKLPSSDTNDIVAYCINLDRRPDRWENVQREWKLFSDHPENLIRISGIDTGSLDGCGYSHQLCVDNAKRNHLPYVIVLEDDIQFKPNARQIWREAIEALAQVKRCDIWRPALSGAFGVTRVTQNLFQVKDGSGLFISVYFESSYDVVLQWTPNLNPRLRHIDRWLTQNPDILNVCTLPFIATTIDGMSDIRKIATRDTVLIDKTESLIKSQPVPLQK